MSKPTTALTPNVEHRLTGWLDIQRRLATAEPTHPRPTITLSRRFGCEAFPVAERLRAIMEGHTRESWMVYDRALLERIAKDDHLSMYLLERVGDNTSGTDLFSFLSPLTESHESLFAHVPKFLRTIARDGNAIIVGRGGAWVTRDMDNCYHFRLEASLPYRVRSIARRLDMNVADAEPFVRKNERVRERFIERHLGCRIDDPLLYHAVFNNERQPVDHIAASIADIVAREWSARDQGVWPPNFSGVGWNEASVAPPR